MGAFISIALMTGLLRHQTNATGPAIAKAKRVSPERIGRYKWGESVIPTNGEGESYLTAFDKTITDYMREVGAPGAALTVFYKGHQVYSKGFGYADVDEDRPFTPQTPTRISSVSKFFTEQAVEDLIEYGDLDPNDKVIDILKRAGIEPLVPKGQKMDPRVSQITIRQLLNHKSGIRAGLDISYCTSSERTRELGLKEPVSTNEAAGLILGLPLDADPGKEYIYSNFGFTLLGKVIEIVTGKPYESWIKEKVVQPMLDPKHWFITTTARKDKHADESDYYSTRTIPTWDAYRWDVCQGAGGWVVPTDELAEFFAKRFSGPGWHYTLFGSYCGAVTVMHLRDDTLTYVANVNYRRGNGPSDNDVLYKRLEDTAKALTLP